MFHVFASMQAQIKHALNYAQIPGKSCDPTPFSQFITAQWDVITPWLRAYTLNDFIYLLSKKE